MLNYPLHIGIWSFFFLNLSSYMILASEWCHNWSRTSICSEVVDYSHNVCTTIVPVDMSFHAVFIVAGRIYRWVNLLIAFLHQ